MRIDGDKLLDQTGWLILKELQQNARISYSELGKRVHLSSPSVAERIAKMEDAGMISGYRAEINFSKLGLDVLAMIHLESIGGRSCDSAYTAVSKISGVLECYRLTGNDSVIVKVAAASSSHLEKIVDQLSLYGIPTTFLLRQEHLKKNVDPKLTSEEI